MQQSLLITFPLPQELNADHAQFVVMHKSGTMPSNPIDSNLPFEGRRSIVGCSGYLPGSLSALCC